MTNRKKVIKGIEICLELGCQGEKCPYFPANDCVLNIMRDTLELLKEQETTLEKDGHHIRCLNCGEYWCDNDREGNPFPMNFCPNCGKKVK